VSLCRYFENSESALRAGWTERTTSLERYAILATVSPWSALNFVLEAPLGGGAGLYEAYLLRRRRQWRSYLNMTVPEEETKDEEMFTHEKPGGKLYRRLFVIE